jgi:hypothetical protein
MVLPKRFGGNVYIILNIGIGLIVLAAFSIISWKTLGVGMGVARAALVFLPVWMIGVGNELIGAMHRPGFAIKHDGLDFVVQFLVPAFVAVIVWWSCKPKLAKK